jgi:hypothetical protein
MIAHSKTRTVGYVRRSTDRQEQSIEDQKKALKLYAAENGLQFLKFYIDDAISGTSAIGRRAFQQMIEDAQSQTPRLASLTLLSFTTLNGLAESIMTRLDTTGTSFVPMVWKLIMSVKTLPEIPLMTYSALLNNGRPVRSPRIYRR